MFEKPSRSTRLVFLCLFVLLSQFSVNFAKKIPPEVQRILRDPETMRRIMEENQPKGEMTFRRAK